MLRPGLQEGEAAEVVQALVLGGDQPAHLGDAVLELDQFVHDILPASLADSRIADEEVRAGNLEVDYRLLMCLVACVKQAFGDRAVLGLERFLAPGVVVLAPEDLPRRNMRCFGFMTRADESERSRTRALICSQPVGASVGPVGASHRVC